MSRMEELSKSILRSLLSDFLDRGLNSDALNDGYVGVSLAMLKKRYCSGNGAATVDFDLAFRELESRDLVNTGPVVPFENTPGSTLHIIGIRSKYEYVYLTEKGYKAAHKMLAAKSPKEAGPHITISGGHFHQSPIGNVATGGSNFSQRIESLAQPGDLRALRGSLEAAGAESHEIQELESELTSAGTHEEKQRAADGWLGRTARKAIAAARAFAVEVSAKAISEYLRPAGL